MGLSGHLYKSKIADTYFSLPYPLIGINYDWGCFRGKVYEELFCYSTSGEFNCSEGFSLYTEEENSDWVKLVAALMRKNFDEYMKNPKRREEMLNKVPASFEGDEENRLQHVGWVESV